MRTTIAAALFAVFGAASSAAAADAAMAAGAAMKTLFGEEVRKLGEIDPATLNVRESFVIKMGHVNLRRIVRDVTVDPQSSSQPQPAKQRAVIEQPNFGNIKTTRLDLDLSGYLLTSRDAVRIKVKLTKGLYSLRDGQLAITAGDANGQQMFFLAKDDPDANTPNRKEIIFYCIYANIGYGAFNIGIVIGDEDNPNSYNIPIYLDPKVRNDGA